MFVVIFDRGGGGRYHDPGPFEDKRDTNQSLLDFWSSILRPSLSYGVCTNFEKSGLKSGSLIQDMFAHETHSTTTSGSYLQILGDKSYRIL